MVDFSQLTSHKCVLAISSHDAGGAEILSSYVRRHHLSPLYVLDGPAKIIFERKLGPVDCITIYEAAERADILLCSTGWQSDLEYESIRLFKDLNKPSVAFLDHWINYRERFIRNEELCLPDAILVGDEVAKKITKELFPDLPIHLEENPYFLDIKDEFASLNGRQEKSQGLVVLYVCEPLREHAKLRYGDERYWGYTEEDALRYFLSNVRMLGKKVREICVRPHPSEPRDKYEWAVKEFDGLPVKIADGRSLVGDIVNCDIVVGCESMAMIIGMLASKSVVSCIPPGGKRCRLPHDEILHLSEMALKSSESNWK